MSSPRAVGSKPASGAAPPSLLGSRGVQVGDLKRMNARLVLAALRDHGPSTGPELADRLAMTKPTVAAALRLLATTDLVTSLGVRAGQVGRSPEVWQINVNAGTVLGIDVGSQIVQASVAGLDGGVLGRGHCPIEDGADPDAVLAAIDTAAAAAHSDAAGEANDRISADRNVQRTTVQAGGAPLWTVIGMPGVVDPASLRVSLSPNVPALGDDAVARGIRKRFGDAVDVQKDVYLAGRGELEARRGEDDDFLLLTIGHGIGAALVRDGRPVFGAGGFAGEIGYLPVVGPTGGARDPRPTSLEDVASLDALLHAAGERGLPTDSADAVFAAGSDPAASQAVEAVIDAEARFIATALCAVVITANPARVVLAGSIALAGGSPFCHRVFAKLQAQLPFSAPPLEIARTGPEATLAGAVSVATERGWQILADGIGTIPA